ncbi:MAG: 4Fe-4S dicluster domain-containing protein [Syntrophorhabdaceae bacterium]|nr:4Fe-4S dicluster domain-containing protein [Syntrophorhabdaceae bacterium]
MAYIPGFFMIEPSAEQSKHRAAGLFVRKEKKFDVDIFREQLKEIRLETRRNSAALIEQLKKTLAECDGIETTSAKDAKEAASLIKAFAGDREIASINKSNVVINEIRPELHRVGLKTYLRYYGEFKNFEGDKFQKKIEDYWSLPNIHDKHLVESFDIKRRIPITSPSESKDYIAILGVNAISAEDGSVYFLQHMSNISKDIEQAYKVVVVLSIEKILKNSIDAVNHTRAMGIFGLESILLDLIPHDVEKFDFDSLPLVKNEKAKEIMFIIYDNGRSDLLNTPYQDLFLCIDCRACARQCPVGQHIPFEKDMVYSPKNYLLGSLQGWLHPFEFCLHCGRCEVECPVNIDIPSLIWRSQFEYYERHPRGLKKRLLDDPELLAKLGCLSAPISNWSVKNPFVKLLTEIFVGINRDANLPTFHRETFRDWFKGAKNV